MRKPALILFVFLLLFADLLNSASGDEPFIVAAPNSKTAIIIDGDWKSSVWYDWGGHEILQRYAELVTGQRLPVVRAQSSNQAPGQKGKKNGRRPASLRSQYSYRIWLGRQPEVERVLGSRLEKLDDDGFLIFVSGSDLYISGKHWWGTNWAVYDLLEKFAGCRWYLMEPDFRKPKIEGLLGPGDIIPAAKSIKVPKDLYVVEQPDYRSRWFRFAPAHSFRLRNRDKFHHNLRNILPPDKYVRAHPEYYPEINGRRHKPANSNDFQPCVTNKDVIQIVADSVITKFNNNPELGSASLGMNDSSKFCHCDECLAVAPPQIKDPDERVAYAFFDFYNKVAQRVETKHVDKRLGLLAYAGLRELPQGSIKLHPMIVPYLTVDSAQMFEPAQVAELDQATKKWDQMSDRMGIYEYMYGFGFVIPRIYNRQLAANIKNRYGAQADGFYAEAYPNWGLDGPKYWLASKLLWDTTLDPDVLLNQFYGDMFGYDKASSTGLSPAAETMKEYFELLEKVWCSQTLKSRKSNYRWFRNAKQLEIFPLQRCEEAWQLLTTAESQAANAKVRKRIRYFKTSFAVTGIFCSRHAYAKQADTFSRSHPDKLAGTLSRLKSWAATGDLNKAVDNARKLGFSALSPAGSDPIEMFDSPPISAIHRLVAGIANRAIEGKKIGDANELKASLSTVLSTIQKQSLGSSTDKQPKEVRLAHQQLNSTLSDVTRRAGLFIETRDLAPTLDGRIEIGEWGEPMFLGHFFRYTRSSNGQTQSLLHSLTKERTCIRGFRTGNDLYLAFDLEQDPSSIGAKVSQRDTSTWRSADMLNDDCIALNIFRPGEAFQHIRVNANGAVSDYSRGQLEWDAAQAVVGRTKTGWQVELKLDLSQLNINPELDHLGNATISIARYTRGQQTDDNGETQAVASTLVPFPYIKSTVGHGNHPKLMVFRSGSRLILEP